MATRRCKRGRRKGSKSCRRKPGPKSTRRSRRSRRRSRKCSRGKKKGSKSCKRKPGPKKGSRKKRRTSNKRRKRRKNRSISGNPFLNKIGSIPRASRSVEAANRRALANNPFKSTF